MKIGTPLHKNKHLIPHFCSTKPIILIMINCIGSKKTIIKPEVIIVNL